MNAKGGVKTMKKRVCQVLTLLCAAVIGLTPACAAGAQNSSGVTYEIFIASFADGNGDGCGDLQGIVDKLDYLEALHVSRIWLMPIHPSPSYHKYDVTDYEAIDPAYGTLEDFETLVRACEERGMEIMLDLVVNHTSSEHPWFRSACEALKTGSDSPHRDWYNFTDKSADGYHAVPEADGWYYEGRFGSHMPDLNLDNAEVRAEIARIMALWQSMGVKGFRLDAVTSYYTGATGKSTEFVRFLNETAKRNDPDCYLVGEAWADENTVLALYQSGVDSLFNFPAADQAGRLLKSAMNGKGAAMAQALADWNTRVRAVSSQSMDAPFLTNHDLGRVRGILRNDLAKEKAAAMLYLLLPGAPTIYYGEELGMSGSGKDENKRLPMVWSTTEEARLCNPPAGADQTQRLKEGADAQEADENSLLNCYRQITALRSLAPELQRGVMEALDVGCDSVAFFKVTDEATGTAVAVLVNASATDEAETALNTLGKTQVLGSYGGALVQNGTAMLPAASCLLLRVE